MSKTEASPAQELGTQKTYLSPVGRRIAEILLRYLTEVKDAIETRPFLDRIVAEEPEIDPGSSYLCDMCGDLTKGREGKLLNNGLFICNRCRGAEMNFDVIPKEGK